MKKIPIVNSPLFAIVDDEDYARLSKHRWRLKEGYAARGFYVGNRTIGRIWKSVYMAREVMGAGQNDIVDHQGHNILDNRKRKLRLTTPTGNSANMRVDARKTHKTTSVFKGVSWDLERSKWTAAISISGKRKSLGRFDSERSAAIAYNQAALKEWGIMACINEITP